MGCSRRVATEANPSRQWPGPAEAFIPAICETAKPHSLELRRRSGRLKFRCQLYRLDVAPRRRSTSVMGLKLILSERRLLLGAAEPISRLPLFNLSVNFATSVSLAHRTWRARQRCAPRLPSDPCDYNVREPNDVSAPPPRDAASRARQDPPVHVRRRLTTGRPQQRRRRTRRIVRNARVSARWAQTTGALAPPRHHPTRPLRTKHKVHAPSLQAEPRLMTKRRGGPA